MGYKRKYKHLRKTRKNRDKKNRNKRRRSSSSDHSLSVQNNMFSQAKTKMLAKFFEQSLQALKGDAKHCSVCSDQQVYDVKAFEEHKRRSGHKAAVRVDCGGRNCPRCRDLPFVRKHGRAIPCGLCADEAGSVKAEHFYMMDSFPEHLKKVHDFNPQTNVENKQSTEHARLIREQIRQEVFPDSRLDRLNVTSVGLMIVSTDGLMQDEVDNAVNTLSPMYRKRDKKRASKIVDVDSDDSQDLDL